MKIQTLVNHVRIKHLRFYSCFQVTVIQALLSLMIIHLNLCMTSSKIKQPRYVSSFYSPLVKVPISCSQYSLNPSTDAVFTAGERMLQSTFCFGCVRGRLSRLTVKDISCHVKVFSSNVIRGEEGMVKLMSDGRMS